MYKPPILIALYARNSVGFKSLTSKGFAMGVFRVNVNRHVFFTSFISVVN